MATQSIMQNIVITEPNAAEILINALEKAADAAKASNLHSHTEYEELAGEDIKKFLGDFIE